MIGRARGGHRREPCPQRTFAPIVEGQRRGVESGPVGSAVATRIEGLGSQPVWARLSRLMVPFDRKGPYFLVSLSLVVPVAPFTVLLPEYLTVIVLVSVLAYFGSL